MSEENQKGVLLPCPHCGSDVRLYGSEECGFFVSCESDCCYGHNSAKHDRDEVIAGWNRRSEKCRAAPTDDLQRSWAQTLIEKLPDGHEGRNSWLINYGVGPEADWLRTEHERNAAARKDGQP